MQAPTRDSSATVASTASALREATMTSAPAATKPPAIMAPMPRVPPVTTTVFRMTENSVVRGAGAVPGADRLMVPSHGVPMAVTVVQLRSGER